MSSKKRAKTSPANQKEAVDVDGEPGASHREADRPDRRDAVRALGAVGLAALASLGMSDNEADAKKSQKASAEHHRRRGRRGKTGPTGPTGPSGGATGPTGPAGPDFTPVLVEATSDAIAVGDGEGQRSKTVTAMCPGGAGTLLGGGYTVNGTFIQRILVSVTQAEPDSDLSSYSVRIDRLFDDADIEDPNSYGARVIAWAICKPQT